VAVPGLAAHQAESPSPRRVSAAAGRKRPADDLVAAAQLGFAGPPPESKHKAAHREKVSVAAALWLPPERDRLHLAYQPLVNGYFSNVEVAEFISGAVQGLPGPVIALWDGGSMHKGEPIRALLEQSQRRLEIEPLPAQAPTLMPVEFLWRWLKYGRLCNFTPRDAHHLNQAVVRELDAILDNQVLLSSLFHQAQLPLPLTRIT